MRSTRRRAAAPLGVAVDVYHVWWDPKLEAQIARAGRERLLAFHVCDWLAKTRDLLEDRGMMGDGVIEIPKIRGWIEAAGFAGYSEVEIFSSLDWWKRPADEVLEPASNGIAALSERGAESFCAGRGIGRPTRSPPRRSDLPVTRRPG